MPACLPFLKLRPRADALAPSEKRAGHPTPSSSSSSSSSSSRSTSAATSPHNKVLFCACEPLPSYGEAAATAATAYTAPSEQCSKSMHALAHVTRTINEAISAKDEELRTLSLAMWSKPEIAWKEVSTYALFVDYLHRQDGWTITPHAHGLKTVFRAEFVHRAPGVSDDAKLPTLGFQSELDALPSIGHACGHNLIAVSGVAASVGLTAALRQHAISARIVLLGTPAEEAAGGKRALLRAGAYEGMDACLMVHPAPLDSVGTMLAVQQIAVHYKGHPAHAEAAPWEGVNAQDAGVLAYVNISALRQQIPPTQRVHGILQGHDWRQTLFLTPARSSTTPALHRRPSVML